VIAQDETAACSSTVRGGCRPLSVIADALRHEKKHQNSRHDPDEEAGQGGNNNLTHGYFTDKIDLQAITRTAAATRAGVPRATVTTGLVRVLGESI
jgi:hypothetical protein